MLGRRRTGAAGRSERIVKPSRFRYSDPVTVDEAIDLLASHENAKVLAGGQSLMPKLGFS